VALLRMSMPRSWTMPGGVQSMTSSQQGQVYLQNQVRTFRIYFFSVGFTSSQLHNRG
jgi:hypothetical protein